MDWGYSCSSEEFGAADLVRFAAAAEDAGFGFVSVSDHFHPWTSRQGHSPSAWVTLGGIAAVTDRVRLATGVTCPLIRQHPVMVAQAAASVSELSEGRFFLGLGSGEALNEHVVGVRWPSIRERQDMLVEAVGIMRQLWADDTVDLHEGYFRVERARLFTLPASPVEVVWAAAGPRSARLAAQHADAMWCTHASRKVVDAYRDAGGSGRVIGQVTLCWNSDEAAARSTALDRWPNAALKGDLSQDLPTWRHFEAATALASEDDVAAQVVCGADVAAVVSEVRAFADAGATAVHFHQVGDDQLPFIEAWSAQLRDELGHAFD